MHKLLSARIFHYCRGFQPSKMVEMYSAKTLSTCSLYHKRWGHSRLGLHKHPCGIQSHPASLQVSNSDHMSVRMIPWYRTVLKPTKPCQKKIRVWPEGSSAVLQHCFEHTDWDMFREAASCGNKIDLQEYADSVTSDINKCTQDLTVTRAAIVCASQKPWLTAEVWARLRTRGF